MAQPDVILIHPPSVYDFRDRTCFYGPISDVIPSSPVFEMYPIGFLTMAAYLRRHGYRVRIINLALLMMRSRRFRPENLLRRLHPKLFGIDLHWLPHAHGGPEVAKLLKQLHPDIPIVFGGISASYFHRELIEDPSIDFVLRGSVTEPCLLQLVRAIEGVRQLAAAVDCGSSLPRWQATAIQGGGKPPHSFEDVPNLTWKRSSQLAVGSWQSSSRDRTANCQRPTANEVVINPATFVPRSLDDFTPDLGMMIGSVVGRLDFWTSVPFHSWWRHPITAVFTVRGCSHRCVTCGASAASFDRFMPGAHPLLRSPGNIAKLVNDLASFTRAPIFLVGDLRDGGDAYADAVLEALAKAPVKNRIIFEFFTPPSREFIERIDASCKAWGAEISPESHDEAIRVRLGKARFTNAAMEEAIATMLANNCRQLDLFYMIGLPEQTYRSVMETVDSIESLFSRFDKRLSAFITPMGPFIDPGSDGFEQAEARGYRIRARTLAEHRALLLQRDWESILNYETEWMTRRQIVDATYDAAERLNALKAMHGRITPKIAAAVDRRLKAARIIRRELAANRIPTGDIRKFSEGTINDKGELFPPGAFLRNFRISGILRLCAREFLRGIRGHDSAHATS